MTEITFHDIQSKKWPESWSPFTIRTLMCLNLLELDYKHNAISYPDIAPTLKSLNVPIPPELSEKKIQYTLPALSLASKTTMGSFEIAELLSSLSPQNANLLFPQGEKTKSATKKLGKQFGEIMNDFWNHVIPFVPFILDERGEKYFYSTREPEMGNLATLRDKAITSETQLGGLTKKVEKVTQTLIVVLEEIDKELKGEEDGEEGVFLGKRKKPSYPDFLVVSLVAWWIVARGEEEIMGALERVGGGRVAEMVRGCQHLLRPKQE